MKKILIFIIFNIVFVSSIGSEGLLVSDVYFYRNSVTALYDIRSLLVSFRLVSDDEQRVYFELCNYYMNYLNAQISLSNRYTKSINNRIHITAPIIKLVRQEMEDVIIFFENNNNVNNQDQMEIILSKIDVLLDLYYELMILVDKYPYDSRAGWLIFSDQGP